ncbi:MAG: hypothetical protein AAF085_16835 [Planctomycetota bacterium]
MNVAALRIVGGMLVGTLTVPAASQTPGAGVNENVDSNRAAVQELSRAEMALAGIRLGDRLRSSVLAGAPIPSDESINASWNTFVPLQGFPVEESSYRSDRALRLPITSPLIEVLTDRGLAPDALRDERILSVAGASVVFDVASMRTAGLHISDNGSALGLKAGEAYQVRSVKIDQGGRLMSLTYDVISETPVKVAGRDFIAIAGLRVTRSLDPTDRHGYTTSSEMLDTRLVDESSATQEVCTFYIFPNPGEPGMTLQCVTILCNAPKSYVFTPRYDEDGGVMLECSSLTDPV